MRLAIEARTGRVHAARTVSAGLNSQLAVVLDTSAGWVFVKGLRADHPGVVRQGREAMINPYVHAVAPRLQWHRQAAGWDLLAFEYIDGARHADYRPGSPDLPRVISAMHDLAAVSCSDLPVKQARQRRPGLGPPPPRAAAFIGLGGNLEAGVVMPAVRIWLPVRTRRPCRVALGCGTSPSGNSAPPPGTGRGLPPPGGRACRLR